MRIWWERNVLLVRVGRWRKSGGTHLRPDEVGFDCLEYDQNQVMVDNGWVHF